MAAPPSGTVTLLFSDIEGSTRLLRRTGPAYPELLERHRTLLREAFERHRGRVLGAEGDGFFVAFESAGDAAAAAAEGQRALAGHEWPDGNEIRVRMGLHTGEPRPADDGYVGLDVHHAARVMAAGHGGQVLVSEATRALLGTGVGLRDLGEHQLKDMAGPEPLYQLEIAGLPAEFPPLNTLDSRFTNLPTVPNAFVGRERELVEAGELLARDDVRLLTLIGPGGTGKTRLALQLAGGASERFTDGAAFVQLAPVRDPELVVPAVAQTLGLRDQPGESALETLSDYLRGKELLLVLDNFEQVLAAAPAVATLLAEAPGLKLLATSRTPLRLSGERAYRVPQLALDEAVELFAERAQAAAPDFRLDDGERGRGRGDLLPARPPAARDRAGRAAGADAHAPGAPAPPRPAAAAADGRRAGRRRAPAHAARHDRVELRPAARAGASAVPAGWACSSAASGSRRPRPSATRPTPRRPRLARRDEPAAATPRGLRRRAALLDARDDPRVRSRAARCGR